MEAQRRKEAAAKAAQKVEDQKALDKEKLKAYQTTNTLTRKFAKIRDGLSMLAP